MTLLAEAKVQGSREKRPGLCPETDGRLEQNLAYSLPAASCLPQNPILPKTGHYRGARINAKRDLAQMRSPLTNRILR